ncbi:AfsR/SARP family transcriptional regulator [Flindersiella endophytica]
MVKLAAKQPVGRHTGTGPRICLLGPFEVFQNETLVDIPAGRQRGLLATLALSAGSTVPIGVLAERIWDNKLPLHPRSGIHNNVLRLRQLLGADLIRTGAGGYLLDVDPDKVDALRFHSLVRAAGQANTAEARDLLTEALALWRGNPLSDVGSDVLEREHAPVLTERYLAAVEQRIDLDLSQQPESAGELIPELHALTSRFPLREPLWERLLTTLCQAGRKAEALETYETVRKLLAEALGSDPSAELKQLHHQILTAPDATTRSQPPPRAARPHVPPTPRQLPPPPGRFVGRSPELTALGEILSTWESAPRSLAVAVVHGIGGIGKTALAVHWAHQVQEHFADGQLYLDLHGYGPGPAAEPATALAYLLRALGVPETQIPMAEAERTALLRTTVAGRRMLLVLDNARDAEQVRPLLPGSGCVVVITSRSRLRGLSIREGARSLLLNELPERAATQLLSDILGAERVESEPEAVAELVELSGRLPLTLRIAAEVAESYPGLALSKLVDDLRSSRGPLDALADDEAGSDLRAVFSWSYDSLAPGVAQAFRCLGLHPSRDISLLSAAALLNRDAATTRGLLGRLDAVHLLDEFQPGRYRLHDLLREYAIEQSRAADPADQRERAFRRVLDWYLHAANHARNALGAGRSIQLTEAIAAPVVPPPDFAGRAEAFEWFEAERSALVAITRAAADSGYDAHSWQLARTMRDFLARRQHLNDFLVVGHLGFTCAQRTGDPLAGYHAAHVLASGYFSLEQYDKAIEYMQLAVAGAQTLDDGATISNALNVLALSCGYAKQFERAVGYHEQAVAAARQPVDLRALGHAELNFGCTLIGMGDHAESIQHTEAALAIYRQLDNAEFQQAIALTNLAEANLRSGKHETAIDYCDQGLAVHRDLGDDSGIVNALVTRGQILAAAGDSSGARTSWREALDLLDEGNPRFPEVTELLAGLDRP